MWHKFRKLILSSISCIVLISFSSSACFDANGNSGAKVERLKSPTPMNQGVIKTETGFVRSSGWEIPSLDSMTITKSGTVEQTTLDGDSLTVDYRLRRPANELLTTEPSVILGNRALLIRVTSVTALSFNGKTFAYSFVSDLVKKDDKSGRYTAEGPSLVYLYVDEDGDGIFEVLKADSSPFYVPQWVYQR